MTNFDISVRRFDEFAEEYATRFMELSNYEQSYSTFCNLLKNENPKILELGCGPGNVTKYIKTKFPTSEYLAVDLAPKMLDIARKNVPEVEFQLMDVRKIDSLPNKYDAIICAFCLPFLSAEDSEQLIKNCANQLNFGGILYISTMEGDASRAGFESTSFSGDSQVYFNYHLQQNIENELIESGFRIEYFHKQNYTEADGTLTIDMIFIGKLTR